MYFIFLFVINNSPTPCLQLPFNLHIVACPYLRNITCHYHIWSAYPPPRTSVVVVRVRVYSSVGYLLPRCPPPRLVRKLGRKSSVGTSCGISTLSFRVYVAFVRSVVVSRFIFVFSFHLSRVYFFLSSLFCSCLLFVCKFRRDGTVYDN